MPGPVSVIIPAHDESGVIAGTLRRLIDTDPESRLELVVAANGCSDDTVAIAAAVSPRVKVVEVAEASKIAALNAGDAAATAFPRAYLDADVRVSAGALLAVADALTEGGFVAGAPRLEVDVADASVFVRWQYQVWALTDYRGRNMIGSGLYLLSEAGRARFDRFPDVIADDLYVLRLFDSAERLSVSDQVFVITAPRTLSSFTRRQARIIAGSEEIAHRFPHFHHEERLGSSRVLIRRIARRPSLWLPAVPYFGSRLLAGHRAARMRGHWASQAWNRDESTRAPGL
ncbi:glycosyltransferase [uncultured Friedmanniella sp.]|uniref:glycosyltransferase n=1 Tax=uncultured Friedmanniella sp. TaxID=335381 RepID=UPI0035C98092